MRRGKYAGRLPSGIKTFNTEVHRGAQRSLGRLSVFIFGIPPGPPGLLESSCWRENGKRSLGLNQLQAKS